MESSTISESEIAIDNVVKVDIIKKKVVTDKEVFVTYSWGSDAENGKVYSLVALLREKGFHADCDIEKMQEKTSLNLKQMMQEGLQYEKVIVVLSEDYKKKAEGFMGGVGTEYRVILNDMADNPNKYIFVAFNEITNEYPNNILPIMLKGTYVLNLIEDSKVGFNELFAKLQNKSTIMFPNVADSKPEIKSEIIKPLSFLGSRDVALTPEKQYVDEAKEMIAICGVEISNNGYSEMKGTNLNTSFNELEDGRVLAFNCKDFDIVDNNIYYYYNVKNKVLYRYENNNWTKLK
nr:toll/interleukin-1 receptor domain-containing protein [Clostridium gasigenes]